ncbi:TraR/DksA family transcriptional regulator [Methylophaga thiooxydans]|uniref:TraR/DksA family transcriptional regulator n=1 Tax=Methylophaga thiooxydans TaxID=392484 RepID=UPI000304E631|nr:TraR/DksA family transcriptional regulator [Methylophaga thiooxydans]
MVDVFDRAQEREQKDRDIAIQTVLRSSRETEQPDEENGIRYCLDCGEPIPNKRLEARPDAVRCVDCQNIKAKRER